MIIQKITWCDAAIFDKEKSTTLSTNASGFVTALAMVMIMRDHLTRISV